ncbi:SPASM domain-containing protein [Paenibacillus sonchi]|uniref:SPASM domain-containing protein n=1 Tax=Paenibacillus sonchi TaxID=373687 RepID=A0A974P7W8_9BACL|nr:radical SAM protein [Paenibacillus sonchi]QQZ58925.1 SPASM domain-containing protein [Paenibacillus sonchi]
MNNKLFKCSKYNHKVKFDDSNNSFLFNCLKGGFIKLPKEVALILDGICDDKPLYLNNNQKENEVINALLKGGFIVPVDFDELQVIEDNFNSVSNSQILSVTIATTMDCNLECYYCYQKRNGIQLTREVCDSVVSQINQKLSQGKYKKLKVDWYGGEPLLAFEQIKYLSEKFIQLTDKLKIEYNASMVSNGTRLTPNIVDELSELKVSNIQITLDGPQQIHNNNRPFKGGNPSFNSVLNGIKNSSKKIDIAIRINVNRETVSMAYELLEQLSNQVVFTRERRIIPYISMIGPISSVCTNLESDTISFEEFYRHVLSFQKEVLKRFPNLEVEDVVEIPKVKYRACGAQNPNSICIDPNGQVFKCGVDVHDKSLGGSHIWEDYHNHSNFTKWVDLNPLKINECMNCKFLPLCMGGCVKHNFKKGGFYEKESCIHWNASLDLILKQIIELKNEKIV